MFAQLPDGTAGVGADPDFPSADQLRAVIVQRFHRVVLKMFVALLQLTAARDDQAMLVDHCVFLPGDFSADTEPMLYQCRSGRTRRPELSRTWIAFRSWRAEPDELKRRKAFTEQRGGP